MSASSTRPGPKPGPPAKGRPLKANPCEGKRPIVERDLEDVPVCVRCGRGVRR